MSRALPSLIIVNQFQHMSNVAMLRTEKILEREKRRRDGWHNNAGTSVHPCSARKNVRTQETLSLWKLGESGIMKTVKLK